MHDDERLGQAGITPSAPGLRAGDTVFIGCADPGPENDARFSAIRTACAALGLLTYRSFQHGAAEPHRQDIRPLILRAEYFVFDLTIACDGTDGEVACALESGHPPTRILLIAERGRMVMVDKRCDPVRLYRNRIELQRVVRRALQAAMA